MTITLELPKELEDRLDTLAENTGRTREDYLRMALEQYLEELEDYNDVPRFSAVAIPRSAEETKRDLGGVEDD